VKVNFFAPLYGHLGYANHARNFAKAMDNIGIDVNLIPIHGIDEITMKDPQLVKLLKGGNAFDPDAISIKLSVAEPWEMSQFSGKKKIGYTVLECSRIPERWVKTLNMMDQAWTTTKWGKETFLASGVKEEIIRIVPEGVDTNFFTPDGPKLDVLKTPTFKFLHVGKWEPRKSQDILCRAFAEEFSKDEDVELYLLSHNPFIPNFNIFVELWKLNLPEHAPIKPITPVTNEELACLYRSVHCFVAPSKGEGWNLPLCEAMSSGLPCIATYCTAHTEYLTEKNAILLKDLTIEEAIDPRWQRYLRGYWYRPSIKELREKMRWVYENYKEAKKIGKRARRDMEKKWTWENAAKKAKEWLEELE